MEGSRVNWSELPMELLSRIGDGLDTSMDVLRFRGVCNSWRSSVSPLQQTQLPIPLNFRLPHSTLEIKCVSEYTIYRLEPIHESTTPPLPIPSKTCLVKVIETKSEAKHPPSVRHQAVGGLPIPVPNVLSLLDFRMVKLGKLYGLSYRGISFDMNRIGKAIKYPDAASTTSSQDCSIFFIYDRGNLGHAKIGDEKLNPVVVNDRITRCNDIVVYRGKVYVVDESGTVWWIDDSTLKLTQFSQPLMGSGGGRKYLLESCGELYVVDRCLEDENEQKSMQDQGPSDVRPRRVWRCGGGFPIHYHHHQIMSRKRTVDFKVYKMDEEKGDTWVEMTHLGDRAFVLSDDMCFSVSSSEFDGCRENCIYFKDRIDATLFSSGAKGFCFFSLEDHTITKIPCLNPICFTNQHIDSRIWILDCFNHSKQLSE